MDLLQLVDLLELGSREQKTSYATPLKLVALGKVMGLQPGTRVIDLGCARGQALILWAKYFGISGLGVDNSTGWCEIAAGRIAAEGLEEQVQVICADAATYPIKSHAYNVACCIGASFIWGGFRQTLRVLRQAVSASGKVVVGEPYYTQKPVPSELIEFEGDHHTEAELLDIMTEEKFALKQILRASDDDRDWYTGFWGPKGQEMYIKYMRPLEGWAMYLMQPVA